MRNDKIKITQGLGRVALEMTGDLTPISLKEARKVMGDSGKHLSDESVLTSILDLTAIARAHIRTVPNLKKSEYNNTYKKVLI